MPMGNRSVSFLGAFRFFLVEGRCTGGSQASKQNEKKRHRNEMIGSAGYPNMSPMFSVPGHFRPHVLNAGFSGHDRIWVGYSSSIFVRPDAIVHGMNGRLGLHCVICH